MAFVVSVKSLQDVYVWLTYEPQEQERVTQLLPVATFATFRMPHVRKALLTFVAFKKGRFEIVGSQRYTTKGFVDLGTQPLVRVLSANVQFGQDATTRQITVQAPYPLQALPVAASAPQDTGHMMQHVAATPDGTETVNLAFGHPFLKRPWFAGCQPIASGLWQRYCMRAKVLTGYRGDITSASRADLDILLAVALQSCTGIYEAERVDDRGIVDLTFGQNNDCDDEATTCCALFLALQFEYSQLRPCLLRQSVLSVSLLFHCLKHYTACAVVVGYATSPTNPDGKPFGHAWAVLQSREGVFDQTCLHIEPTAPMTTNTPSAQFSRVYLSSDYNKRAAEFKRVAIKTNLRGNRIVGTRVAERTFYRAPIWAVSANHQYVWPKNTSTLYWLDLLLTKVTRAPPHAISTHGRSDPDELHHMPNRVYDVPTGYHLVQNANIEDPPDTWQGVVAVNPRGPLPKHCMVVDSFNIMQFVM